MLPVFAPQDRREEVQEYLAAVNPRLELGQIEMLDDRPGEVQFAVTVDAWEDGIPSEERIRAALAYHCQTVDRCFPGLMAVMFANAAPSDAIRLFTRRS